jgi:heme/copper-type cytochrome/quinol oxidase subunit 2
MDKNIILSKLKRLGIMVLISFILFGIGFGLLMANPTSSSCDTSFNILSYSSSLIVIFSATLFVSSIFIFFILSLLENNGETEEKKSIIGTWISIFVISVLFSIVLFILTSTADYCASLEPGKNIDKWIMYLSITASIVSFLGIIFCGAIGSKKGNS